MTHNSAHQPLAVKDSAGQTTTYTYNGQGQVLTITTPPRAGITENCTTTWSYNTNGYLQSVTGPATGATTSYTYDSYGRTRTVTDSDNYTVTFDYDALDRQTRVTYPDATFEETIYERLDPVRTRDRLGRWIHRVYDSVQRVIATTDPLGRTVTRQWCGCGSLEAVIDANGNRTEWERDIQGRVTKVIRANGSEWVYAYETTTSRLKTVTDPKAQVKTYSYLVDDNLQGISYTNEQYETPNVSFTYETAFNRVSTMVDGTGTTTYGYHPLGGSPPLGAGKLASVDGPLSNDVIASAYDELGRVESRAINGVTLTYGYDALGRIITENNVLGAFSYQYESVTSRIRTVTYPNGQTSSYAYYANSGDHRLQEIHHKKSGGTTLSKFNYTYDAVGNILTWTQQQDTNPAKAYDFAYDREDQLRTAVWRTTDPAPTVLKRYAYSYDPAGNRTVEQIDDTPVLSAHDSMNRLTSQAPGGTLRFAGTLNEAATVTIQGQPATVTSDNKFERGAQVSSGTNQVVVKAKDYAGNERTNTYEVSISGSSKTFTFDASGNVTGDGTRTFEWDAENRLLAVKQGITTLASFSYDGEGRRDTKTAGGVTTTYVYDGPHIIEERSGGGTVRYAYGNGVDDVLAKEEATDTFYYVKDHLKIIRQVTNASGAVVLTREYDPWGNLLQASTTSGYAYTGREWDAETGLYFYRARYYDPQLGRFMSEDPIRFSGGVNFYAYALGNPLRYTDPFGLAPCPGGPKCGKEPNDAAKEVCKDAGNNPALPAAVRKCIKNQCDQGWKVYCHPPGSCPKPPGGGPGEPFGVSHRSGDVHICAPTTNGRPCELKNTILHEMLHSCISGPNDISNPPIDAFVQKIYPCPAQ